MDVSSELAKRKQSLPIKFSKRQQERIKKKYENRCALCCLGVEDGVDVCVVHKTALVDGGKATIKNGQVLCTEHSETRYNIGIDPTKSYISLMLKVSQHRKDEYFKNFLLKVLKVYDDFNINCYIK